jgi:hypothetical protein
MCRYSLLHGGDWRGGNIWYFSLKLSLLNQYSNKQKQENFFVNNLFGIFKHILHFKSVVGLEYIDISTDSTLVGSL